MRTSIGSCLLAALAAGTIAACTDRLEPTSASAGRSAATSEAQTDQTQYWCETHWEECHGGEDPPGPSDPNPSAPGYWLGTTVTPDVCISPTGAGINDVDHDGLSDYCERMLGAAFAPELKFNSGDNLGGQPRWVAQPSGADVVIGYLFAYYMDFGSRTTTQCKAPWLIPIPFVGGAVTSECDGHNGDSEQIKLVIHYDATTEHWLVASARYYAHEGYAQTAVYPSGYAEGLEYPEHEGGYPRVWVSLRKHASYFTQYMCNLGGTAGVDTCVDHDTSARLVALNSSNIGSRSYHTGVQDSTYSTDPFYAYYGAGRVETFWTDRPFRGWVPDSIGGGQSSSYSSRLAVMGF